MIKKTSKITILASLLVAGMVNAQEFYTCVPKKSWWKNTMSESIKSSVLSANDIANAVAKGIKESNKKEWRLVNIFTSSWSSRIDFPLSAGKYKVIVESHDEFFFEILTTDILQISEETYKKHKLLLVLPSHRYEKEVDIDESNVSIYLYTL